MLVNRITVHIQVQISCSIPDSGWLHLLLRLFSSLHKARLQLLLESGQALGNFRAGRSRTTEDRIVIVCSRNENVCCWNVQFPRDLGGDVLRNRGGDCAYVCIQQDGSIMSIFEVNCSGINGIQDGRVRSWNCIGIRRDLNACSPCLQRSDNSCSHVRRQERSEHGNCDCRLQDQPHSSLSHVLRRPGLLHFSADNCDRTKQTRRQQW